MDLSRYTLSPLRAGNLTLQRGSADGMGSVLLVSAAQNASLALTRQLEHEYALRAELDTTWAARPIALTRHRGLVTLVLADPGGDPLDQRLRGPLEAAAFLRQAIRLVSAIRGMHGRGLIHKDLKPANFLVDPVSGNAWLTGFGFASRVPREQQTPNAPEVIAGTLAYMAPEQTGRMNRSIDARSDLYSLGITFYEMLTGVLPFSAADPLEWVHCHIARQPTPPGKRLTTVPAQLSALVMKLLAKTAEERYQTAGGVESDLRRCQSEWESYGRIKPFALGAHDASDRLSIPEKLYGRERDVQALLGAFERVVTHGTIQLVLVSGYAGIGKSSLVNELHKALVPSRGLFASGKFDQYKRGIPYATLGEAFRSLVRTLLGCSEAQLHRWREALHEALGPNGQLVVNLVPELELIIGTAPPLPELAPQDARNRFQMVLRRFLGVFSRPEHPLALFLDDLQWLDAATLELLANLLTSPDPQHLMLIGAYRDNEVDATHPLMQTLEVIRRAGATPHEIVLSPLSVDDLQRLLVDCLHCDSGHIASLAQLVHQKTAGNPFFAVQFITSLAEEGLLTFDRREERWTCDLHRIHAKGYSNNVADLMVGKLGRLPQESRRALQQLACLGNSAEFDQLKIVYEDSHDRMHDHLREAVRAGLLVPSERGYRFVHDRVQEAAYASLPEEAHGAAHLRIGRLLTARSTPGEIEDRIFEIVSQLNRGRELIRSPTERAQVAALNLMAGQRAKASIAYASALSYLCAGRALLTQDCWQQQYRLIFDLELSRAQCEFLTGEASTAQERLTMLSTRAASLADLAAVIVIQVSLYTNLGEIGRAVEICLGYLQRLGVAWSAHPTDQDVHREYELMRQRIDERPIGAFIDLPRMVEVKWRTLMDAMAIISMPAGLLDTNLMDLVVLRMANLSLEHGNSDASCAAYVHLSLVLGPRFGDYQTGYHFGQLSVDLVDKLGVERFKTQVFETFAAFAIPWLRHIRDGYTLARRACEAGPQGGDLTFSSYAWWTRVTSWLGAGEPLGEVQAEAELGLEFARRAHFALAVDLLTAPLRLIRMLRGLTSRFGTFDSDEFDESSYEQYLEGNAFKHATSKYWIRKLQARFYAEDYVAALAAEAKARSLLAATPPAFELAEYHFYAALSHAATCVSCAADEVTDHLTALVGHHAQLMQWARDCPANFENFAALAGAEIARLEGRELDAERLYQAAIQTARANGFVQNEGLAHELAARFYAARGFETIGHAHLQNARSCYLRWGADAKVRQIDLKYPHLVSHTAAVPAERANGTPVEQLDFATVMKVSQTIAVEIEFSRVIEILMETALEQAGAERGLLILPRGERMWIEAEARTADAAVVVSRPQKRVSPSALPQSVFHYVMRTRDCVLLDDATKQEPFSADEYVQHTHSRSILCLPLLKQTQLVGVLYLENALASHVFTPARIALLRLVASQAATSLENARLYSELRDTEEFLAQAEHLSATGSFAWHVDVDEIRFSRELRRIFGFEPELPVTLERIEARVHPEDMPLLREKIGGARRETGDLAYEIRLRMPDGTVKYVCTDAHATREPDGRLAYIGVIQDVSQRRLSEEAISAARSELAQIARVTSLGALTAAIVHEVTQPLAAIVTNADGCLRWLAKEQPNLHKARQSASRIVKDGHRAGNVVEGIRALVLRSSSATVSIDISRLIAETLDLMQAELQRHEVSLETRFAATVGPIKADRTQLQQVVVNLVTNGIEAMGASRRRPRILRVSTQPHPQGGVLTQVEDSGTGMDEAILKRIFEPRFTTKAEGMGLGLSICRSIVEGHGGRLWASPSPTGGSIFQFNIPAPIDEPPVA